MKMKNNFLTIAACLLLSASAFAQSGADLLHQRLMAFAESGEYDIHRVDSTNPYVRAYRFEKVFSMAGISDSRFLFESLRQLEVCRLVNLLESLVYYARLDCG